MLKNEQPIGSEKTYGPQNTGQFNIMMQRTAFSFGVFCIIMVKAGVHVNRSEILSVIKRELLVLKCVGNTTRQWTSLNESPRLVGDCFVSVY